MKLTIVVATGGIGPHLVEQAVAGGHDVTAVARRPRELPDGGRAAAVDLTRPDMPALAAAVRGTDAVLSTLGPRNLARGRGHHLAGHPRDRHQQIIGFAS